VGQPFQAVVLTGWKAGPTEENDNSKRWTGKYAMVSHKLIYGTLHWLS